MALARKALPVGLFISDLKLTSGTNDDFGRPADMWKYEKEEVGTYAHEADLVYTAAVAGKTIYKDLGKPTGFTVKDSAGTAGKMDVDGFRRVIEQKDRCRAGTSVPGNALFLVDVTYPDSLFM